MIHHLAPARAQSLFLRAAGMTIKEITTIEQVDRDTVSTGIRTWAPEGPASLHDTPRSGRPPKRTPEEHTLAIASIKEDPRSLTPVGERFTHQTAQRRSIASLKRLAKRARLRWKRVRKSGKSRRDPGAFARGKRALAALQKPEDQGQSALDDFDEAGLALAPSMPYAWQESETMRELPAMPYGRMTVWGGMHRKNDVHASRFDHSVPTGVVMACCEACCQTIKQKTVGMIDHASIHTREACEDRIPSWKPQGCIITSLPTYAPEFNRIAILWRRIHYDWLPFSASSCLHAMIEALDDMLRNVGSKYQITFA
jgi:transposase